MPAQKGALVIIKVGNSGAPETFSTIGGLQASRLVINNQTLDSSNKETGAWRNLLSNIGTRFVSISGSGVFTDSASEETIRGYAFAGSINNYQFIFANGDYITGPFIVKSYDRSGDYDGEERCSITLDSAGAINYTIV